MASSIMRVMTNFKKNIGAKSYMLSHYHIKLLPHEQVLIHKSEIIHIPEMIVIKLLFLYGLLTELPENFQVR